ncbi:MAG: serine/threonine-protein phosphatase [Acidobacteria bacterium]|nr:serine/threonine-protein phosphatase [Acidobacteriota bacterium]
MNANIYILSIGFVLALALLHLLLYLFYPRQRANLFFSLFAFSIAVRQLTSDVLQASDYGAQAATIINLAKLYSLGFAVFAFVLFLYAAFSLPVARQFWVVLALWLLIALAQTVSPPLGDVVWLRLVLPTFVVIESLRIIVRALIEKRDGAWIIGLGVALLASGPLKDVLAFKAPVSQFWNVLVNQLAICGIIIANSVFLARAFARTNRNLEEQLVQVKELSERELEHERTAAELRVQNEQERARLALVEQELALAASIQQELFPQRMPEPDGYNVAAQSRPARVCGGDYYDALHVASENGAHSSNYLFCVADVSGKGLPAALLMSNMQASLRALVGQTHSLTELAAQINELLHAASPANKFVTALLVEVDTATGSGRYVNAGHNECILLRQAGRAPELLKSTGLPLGMLPGSSYEEQRFELRAGDLLALYSDGVSEAYNKDEEEWGEARLVEHLTSVAAEPASRIVESVFAALDRFADGTPQHDDITLLILKPQAA